MTELYQHVEHHPSIAELVESWHHRIAGEIAYERAKAGAAAIHAHDVAVDGDNKHLHELLAEIDACDARIKELQAARVIALDIIPGAVPMEAYAFPKRCLLLFGAEGPGLSEKALALADDVVYISQFGSVRSINAGAAAAVAMHAWDCPTRRIRRVAMRRQSCRMDRRSHRHPEKRISNNDPSACPAEMVSKGRKMRFPDNCVSHTAHIVMAMPTFSREEIVHLGDLARIALTDEEITRLQGELNVIADSINKVQEVASDDVPPTANPVPLEAYLRPDVAETPLTQEEALAGGPKTEAGMFVAPRILGSEE